MVRSMKEQEITKKVVFKEDDSHSKAVFGKVTETDEYVIVTTEKRDVFKISKQFVVFIKEAGY